MGDEYFNFHTLRMAYVCTSAGFTFANEFVVTNKKEVKVLRNGKSSTIRDWTTQEYNAILAVYDAGNVCPARTNWSNISIFGLAISVVPTANCASVHRGGDHQQV